LPSTPRGLSLVEPVRETLLRIQATLGTQPTFDPGTVQRTFTLIVSADALLRVRLRLFRAARVPAIPRIVDLRPVKWLCAVAKDHPTVGDELTEAQYLALPHVFGGPSGHTTY
jgi:hypothetical protein